MRQWSQLGCATCPDRGDFCGCNIAVDFDWPGWDEGRRLIETGDFGSVELLTAIIRSDRFCEGELLSALENGTIPNVIRAMKDVAVGD